MAYEELEAWPALNYADWAPTGPTLHFWTQIVGKVRVAVTPWLNHSWQVPLYVSARGLTTGLMTAGEQALELEFDFVDERLRLRTGRSGDDKGIVLEPMSVAMFYRKVMDALKAAGFDIEINPYPNELPEAVAFDEDDAPRAFNPAQAFRFWRALLQADRVLKRFRTGFLGKASPVHFFWGSFDLAATRFSGRRAPPHPGGVPHLPDAVAREAYSHEVSSAGFWPGGPGCEAAVFYSYAYPEPAGFRLAPGLPVEARYDTVLGEFVLPYEAVRRAAEPDALLLSFLNAAYAAAADGGGWDRAALDCDLGVPGRPRSV